MRPLRAWAPTAILERQTDGDAWIRVAFETIGEMNDTSAADLLAPLLVGPDGDVYHAYLLQASKFLVIDTCPLEARGDVCLQTAREGMPSHN